MRNQTKKTFWISQDQKFSYADKNLSIFLLLFSLQNYRGTIAYLAILP